MHKKSIQKSLRQWVQLYVKQTTYKFSIFFLLYRSFFNLLLKLRINHFRCNLSKYKTHTDKETIKIVSMLLPDFYYLLPNLAKDTSIAKWKYNLLIAWKFCNHEIHELYTRKHFILQSMYKFVLLTILICK